MEKPSHCVTIPGGEIVFTGSNSECYAWISQVTGGTGSCNFNVTLNSQ